MAARKVRTADVGDTVTFKVGTRHLIGTIVEDRGSLGVAGRRLVRVSVGTADEASEFELPADQVLVSA